MRRPSQFREGVAVSGYELEIDQLRQAAAAARSCADQLRQVDAAATIGAVPAALPGARSGSPIATLANSWRQQVTALGGGFLGHATSLTRSADLYAASDTAAAEVFAPAYVDDTRGES
jgi:putative heme degradation protein